MSLSPTVDVEVAADAALLVRPGCFVRHPQCTPDRPVVPFRSRLAFSRLKAGSYVLFRVINQTFSITSPYSGTYVTRVDLGSRDILFIRLDHVLAFSENCFPARKWQFDLISAITRRWSYTYFCGPGTLYALGVNGLTTEHVDGAAEYDSNKVVGWTHTLRSGVTSKHSWLTAALGKTEVCIDLFEGKGMVLVQSSGTPISRLERANYSQGVLPWVDFVCALLGLPWQFR
jgi:uncharacterized protein (AIM24 family)